MAKNLQRITCVLAQWCPHCVPATTDVLPKIGEDLHVPVRILDIDQPEQEKLADDIVKKHGDWSPDYIIPQVFFEYSNGEVLHIFTGFSEGLDITKKSWVNFLKSGFYKEHLSNVN